MRFAVVLLILVSFSSLAEKDAKKSWHQQMRTAAKVLREFLPDVLVESRFQDPKNKKRIEDNIKRLRDLSHDFDSKSLPDRDPTLDLVQTRFKEELSEAKTTFESGLYDYSRSKLIGVASYCIACHTRSQTYALKGDVESKILAQLSNFEKGDYFNATRQFEKALDSYQKVYAEKENAKTKINDWMSSVERTLLIGVRVLRDPSKTSSLLRKVRGKDQVQYSFQTHISDWLTALREWEYELESGEKRSLKTTKDYFNEAKRLMDQAKAYKSHVPQKSRLVPYLRASSVLHDLARAKTLSASERAKLFLWLGQCYEAIDDLDLSLIYDYYYAACIEALPGSKIARQCYKHFEEALIGDLSVRIRNVPKDIRAKLARYKKLSRKK